MLLIQLQNGVWIAPHSVTSVHVIADVGRPPYVLVTMKERNQFEF